MERTDGELAAAYLQGDEASLRTLIERYADPLLRFAQRFTRNEEDSEDIVQECFIRLVKSLPKLDLSQPLKPWLYKVCANLCHNLARDKRSLNFSQLEGVTEEGELPPFVEQLEDTEDSPDIVLDRSLQAGEVKEALEKIPEKYRTILLLYYNDGLSYEEIATALDLPLNTVRTHLKRAKDRLARELSPPHA